MKMVWDPSKAVDKIIASSEVIVIGIDRIWILVRYNRMIDLVRYWVSNLIE